MFKLREKDLRLVQRGKYLYPDRNYDYFRLKHFMFYANLNQSNGIRLLMDSNQYDRILEEAGKDDLMVQCTYEEETDGSYGL